MKKLIVLFVCGAFILAGCKQEPIVDPEEDCQVVIFFSAKTPLTKSSLKSTTPASQEEKDLTSITLFAVDGTDNVVGEPFHFEGTDLTSLETTGSTVVTIKKKVTKFYAVANASTELATEMETAADVSALLALAEDFDGTSISSFLMSGIADIIVTGNVYSAHIKLARAVAKIDIVGDNDFVIESVTVKNTPDQGYVFPQDPFSVPNNMIDYATVESLNPEESLDPTLYVPENSKSNPTKFFVVGTFKDKRAEYTIELSTTKEGVIDIMRNTYYKVSVSPVTEVECTITIQVLDWEDGPKLDEYEIPDEEFEDIIKP